MSLSYRPELDGLRALAVVPVVLFHAKITGFTGGFIGVDIFFVISGFLITGIILKDLENGTFTIIKFYDRRIRRILPALLSVCLACTIFGWLLFTPAQFHQFGKTLATVAIFGSNIYFWRTSGYWEVDAEIDPLRHTWSLSVEEQFYIFFPIAMMVFWRIGRFPLFLFILLCGTLSFGLALFLGPSRSWFTFYNLPTRGFEMAVGSLMAFYSVRVRCVVAEILSLTAILAVFATIYLVPMNGVWPNQITLIPVFATATLLVTSQRSFIIRNILSFPLLRGIGLISYSLYLWHQPILAFWRIEFGREPSLNEAFFLFFCCVVISWASWKFVENPFRSSARTIGRSRKVVISGLFGLSVTLLIASVIIVSPNSLIAFRYPDAVKAHQLALQVQTVTPHKCGSLIEDLNGTNCYTIGTNGPRLLIWGDSHAERLARNFTEVEPGYRITVISHPGCPPSSAVLLPMEIDNDKLCHSRADTRRLAALLEDYEFEIVLLIGRWSMYLQGLHVLGEMKEQNHFLVLDESTVPTKESTLIALHEGLLQTAKRYSDRKIYAVQQVPDLLSLTSKERFIGKTVSRESIDDWHRLDDTLFEDLEASSQMRYIFTRDLFCDMVACGPIVDGLHVYSDDNHINAAGVELIWERIEHALSSD